MARIGLKYIVGAVVSEYKSGELPVLKDGFIIGRAITADKNINFAENPLYADDSTAENEYTFESGTLSLNVDEITLETQAKMYGHKYVPAPEDAEGATAMLTRGGANQPPHMAVGYYKTKVHYGKKSYEVTIIYKVKFSPPNESAKTKEKSITWGTPTTEGTIETLDGFEDDIYENTYEFPSEDAALRFVQKTFGMIDENSNSGNTDTENTDTEGTDAGTEDTGD